MKTKTIFMLAAMLLMSIGAFAQNNEPLEGDVNNDGTVDVADIVGILKIMKDGGGAVGEKMCYWYSGTNNGNAVTADNFTDVASRIPESEVPETGSVTANGQYVYFVMPETKHLESLTDGNGSAVEFTCIVVMGYHIYKTAGMISGMINYTIEQTIYYWYVGQTAPTSTITEVTGAQEGWHKIGPSIDTYTINSPLYNSISNPIAGSSKTYWYVAVPSTSSLSIHDSGGGNEVIVGNWNLEDEQITAGNVTYNVYKSVGTYRDFNVWLIY